jgi:hypothetical protein
MRNKAGQQVAAEYKIVSHHLQRYYIATIGGFCERIRERISRRRKLAWVIPTVHLRPTMETLEKPTTLVERPKFKSHYDNFIGGKWVAPVKGQYFENPSPIDGKAFTKVARSTKEDIELALDAAHEAFKSGARPRRPPAATCSSKLPTSWRPT